MFSYGDNVELDVCIGEDTFGIPRDDFARLCNDRKGNFLRSNRNEDLDVTIMTCSGRWSFSSSVVKKIGRRDNEQDSSRLDDEGL